MSLYWHVPVFAFITAVEELQIRGTSDPDATETNNCITNMFISSRFLAPSNLQFSFSYAQAVQSPVLVPLMLLKVNGDKFTEGFL